MCGANTQKNKLLQKINQRKADRKRCRSATARSQKRDRHLYFERKSKKLKMLEAKRKVQMSLTEKERGSKQSAVQELQLKQKQALVEAGLRVERSFKLKKQKERKEKRSAQLVITAGSRSTKTSFSAAEVKAKSAEKAQE